MVKKASATEMPPKEGKLKKETACPITPSQFVEHAKPFTIEIFGNTLTVNPKEFSTGSFGWNAGGQKITVDIGGIKVKLQVGLNCVVVGSKKV